ncbi:MAG: hypothetical protein AAFW68_07140 [Pseudomonadota bacterium]
MARRSGKLLTAIKQGVIALFAIAQLFPAGTALAQDDDGFAIVICTPNGAETVSWEGVTGEAAPFAGQQHDPSASPCHACFSGSCAKGKARLSTTFLPNVVLMTPMRVEAIKPLPLFEAIGAGPPMPSRAPPAFVI